MRLNALFILVALLVSVLSPLNVHISTSSTGHVKYLVSLDVCNASGASISANSSDAPVLHAGPYKPVPFNIAEFIETHNSSFNPFFYFAAIDRPPKN